MFFNEGDITNMFKTCCILHNMLLDWDGLAGTGQQDEDWIADDKLDLTTMLEEVRKRREDLKKARNPNYRGAPAHPVDSVRISCTITCILPVNGTKSVFIYSITGWLQTMLGTHYHVLLMMTLAGLEALPMMSQCRWRRDMKP